MIPSQPSTGAIDPVFPGGALALQRFVDQAKQPISTTTSGTVSVEFVVNVDGSVSDYTILKGAGLEADSEAVRIVSVMPEWTPGTVNGEPARFKFVLPIDFRS